MTDIVTAARELTRVVDGADWELTRVRDAQDTLYAALDAADGDMDEAFTILLDRLSRSCVDDGDGVAYVAITAGALVEAGASARRLGDVLLPKLVPVLHAARRYADWCLGQLPPSTDSSEKNEEDIEIAMADAALHIDGRPIPRDLFRAGRADDRPGATSLYFLRKWVLPTVAALTRDRTSLQRAIADQELVAATRAVAEADAYWLDVLLGVELGQTWMVLCPMEGRAFWVEVDGIADNFTLHVLLADALGRFGIPTAANPPELFDYLRGRVDQCPRNHIIGSFTMYDFRAASCDVAEPMKVVNEYYVWGEGNPRDVPRFEGFRTLVVGPPWAKAILGSERTFRALPTDVKVIKELTPEETRTIFARAASALPSAASSNKEHAWPGEA
ncbi:hypothetical protein [Nocardia flavorosea]|uniref:Uncharacterized protein n=1 Tax=Nocardia flavorosea TaxID=53429 RepID=A0A846YEJ9_9NOCA|nr:hypothetical protein [Nocardia flavorosea]NKY55598.1 hypothetical protein [Nocardia flavorosea]